MKQEQLEDQAMKQEVEDQAHLREWVEREEGEEEAIASLREWMGEGTEDSVIQSGGEIQLGVEGEFHQEGDGEKVIQLEGEGEGVMQLEGDGEGVMQLEDGGMRVLAETGAGAMVEIVARLQEQQERLRAALVTVQQRRAVTDQVLHLHPCPCTFAWVFQSIKKNFF